MNDAFGTTHARVWFTAWPDDGLIACHLDGLRGYVFEEIGEGWSKAVASPDAEIDMFVFGNISQGPGKDDPRIHWVEWIISEFGADGAVLLGAGEMTGRTNLLAWMMVNGVAPDQPFCVEFTGYSQSRSYEGEYDSEWSADVIEKAPWTDAQVADAWEKWVAVDFGTESR